MTPRENTEARVRSLLADRDDVEEKRLMGSRVFMVGGAMCCSVGDAGLLVRVAPADRDALLASPHVTPMTFGGRTMRGFVRLAPAAYRTAPLLAGWLERGIAAGKPRRNRK